MSSLFVSSETPSRHPSFPFSYLPIVEQAQRHIERIPSFEGIAIDRLDYSEFFNFDRDDGVSFVPVNGSKGSNYSTWVWGRARALRLSYRHTYARLHEVLHARQTPPARRKLMLNNCNWLCRLDENRYFDGTFSEGAALNSVAWTGLRQPTILWTYALSGTDPADLDLYFQQHLLMNVYPMAPMAKNDHSIVPGNPTVERAYREYAPLFDAMHGARWLLTARPARVDSDSDARRPTAAASPPFVNVFTRRPAPHARWPELLVPIMLADEDANATTLTLSLAPATEALGWPPILKVGLSALYPGAPAPRDLGDARSAGSLAAGVWQARVPLVRGCAFVQVTLSGEDGHWDGGQK